MRFKRFFSVLLIVLIIAVNALTVYLLIPKKQADTPLKNDALFGEPSQIIYHSDDRSTVQKDMDTVVAELEKSHRYVFAFSDAELFSTDGAVWLELIYDTPHTFSDGYNSFETDNIKIDLYHNSGALMLQTADGQVGLGYLDINSALIDAISK